MNAWKLFISAWKLIHCLIFSLFKKRWRISSKLNKTKCFCLSWSFYMHDDLSLLEVAGISSVVETPMIDGSYQILVSVSLNERKRYINLIINFFNYLIFNLSLDKIWKIRGILSEGQLRIDQEMLCMIYSLKAIRDIVVLAVEETFFRQKLFHPLNIILCIF